MSNFIKNAIIIVKNAVLYVLFSGCTKVLYQLSYQTQIEKYNAIQQVVGEYTGILKLAIHRRLLRTNKIILLTITNNNNKKITLLTVTSNNPQNNTANNYTTRSLQS